MFYVMFWPEWLTERAKKDIIFYGGRYSGKWNWFEFDTIEDAKAFLRSVEDKYIRFSIDRNHYSPEGNFSLRYKFSGPIFTGLTAAEIFAFND